MNEPDPKLISVELPLDVAKAFMEETRIRIQQLEQKLEYSRNMLKQLEEKLLISEAKDVNWRL